MIVGITRADPYVPAVPTLGIEIVVDPPNATVDPPERPVPAVTVIDDNPEWRVNGNEVKADDGHNEGN